MRDANKQNTIQTQTIHEVRAKKIGTSDTHRKKTLNLHLKRHSSQPKTI